MAIQDDFSINAAGDIRYTGSTANYTVIELHRWFGDLMDDAQASGNDILDITDATASERATDNLITLLSPYNIDDTAAEHIYDGSIVQDGGATIYDGIVVYAPQGTYVEIIQNAAKISPNFWTTGLNGDSAQGISHRFMVKVRSGGVDTDGRRLLGQTREFGKTYSEFPVNGTARGNNVIALNYADDLNNTTDAGVVSGWTTISNTEGYNLLDVNNDTVNEPYYSKWFKDTYSINQLYERAKWLTRRGTGETLYGLNGEIFRGITHEIDITSGSGTWVQPEGLTWTGGSGQLMAVDDTDGTGTAKLWLQLVTGVPPSGNIFGAGGAIGAGATVTERTTSRPFIGASTGAAIIGAYGIGITVSALTAADKLFDLTNTQRTPPNNVTFSVAGLSISEDRVLVGPESGGSLQTAQFTLATTLSGGAETTVVVGTTIASDTPSTGTIRVEMDSGIFRRLPYTSYGATQFNLTGSTSFTDDNATSGNDVYISYIDKLADATSVSFTSVYLSDRSLFIRVRDGGGTPIKTFETTGTLGSAGGSAVAIRTSDA